MPEGNSPVVPLPMARECMLTILRPHVSHFFHARPQTMFNLTSIRHENRPTMTGFFDCPDYGTCLLEAAVYDGRFHFNGDPILSWAISNVVCHRDKNDNLFPNKERYENKIDPVTALLTALNRVMATAGNGEGSGVSVFDKCAKCPTICEGTVIGEKVIFDCGKHTTRFYPST
jgi:hypothetical protein